MLRLLKLAMTAVLTVALVVIAAGWIGLERAARRSGLAAAQPWEKRLSFARISSRVMPPSAVIEDAVLANAEGDELLRARAVVLPLLPGAWTGHGAAVASPRLEDWTLTLDVPRDDAANWAEGLADPGLPKPEWWSGRDGEIVVRVGGEKGESLRFTGVDARRRKYSFSAQGRVAGVPGSSARLDGSWDPSRREPVSFALAAGPIEAAPWTAWLLAGTEGRVRGGRAALEASVTFPAGGISFDGTLKVSELLVEGTDATPGALEALLARGKGSGTLSFHVQAPLGAAADWRSRMRDELRAAAQRSAVTATR